ncbi:transcription factor VOZ1-like isoform X2 [Prosopis cineraria]|uniref:transcription factor VOZ1-like isoform X2 n=1 Tax=Prosopis cineraria TaxID=364024 RepID=UPI00240EE993|nr:transcription factor VOZ1-like isoform X2 [Prosopis cineraria]
MDDSLKNQVGSSSDPSMKNKAKQLVDDLQGIFVKLRTAREENRDIVIFEEQVHQMLQEWKTELNKPSPASSLADGNFGLFPEELAQLLQELEEEDNATSELAKSAPLKTEPDLHNTNDSNHSSFQDCSGEDQQGHALEDFSQYEGAASTTNSQNAVNNLVMITQSDDHQFNLNQDVNYFTGGHKSDLIEQCDIYQEYRQNSAIKSTDPDQFILDDNFDCNVFVGVDDIQQSGEDIMPNILPNICPPPSAFLGPKCALWDCFRPAQGLKCCQDYCCSSHELLANNEGLPGMTPILRPGGIGVKDGPLFAAVNAKTLGKEVGIPNCEGAASTKSPWNAPELFDLSLFEGEMVREWLFFDKPRRAFDSGNRKQRSLPDYSGRGWHESRKQVMKEYGGQKRSYYMDPQPLSYLEWHLYEYAVNKHDGYALYRLELKLVDKKKSPKGKVTKESLADIQNKMGKLTADVP